MQEKKQTPARVTLPVEEESSVTPNTKDFPALIRWLADTYHQGAVMHVGQSAGIGQATAHKWAHGRAVPTLGKLSALCEAYRLDFSRVVEMVKATKPPKLVVGLLAGLLALASVHADAAAPPVDMRADGVPIMRSKFRRWIEQWWCVLPRLGWSWA